MRNEEIMLTHGEVNMTFEMDEKVIGTKWGGTDHIQHMYVTMVDCFDNITMKVSAVLIGDLRPEWEFTAAKYFTAGDENELSGVELAQAIEDGKRMTTELVDNHELLTSLTDHFYR